MSKEELINTIEDPTNWSVAKHRAADHLLTLYPDKETREYLWNRFVVTGDYYYNSILKS